MKKALNTLKTLFLKIKAHQKDFWSTKGKSGWVRSTNLY